MDKKMIADKIRKMFSGQLKKRGADFNSGDKDSIIASGILDSLSALEFIAELEKKFNVTISQDEMTEANFDSVIKITDFLSRKLESSK